MIFAGIVIFEKTFNFMKSHLHLSAAIAVIIFGTFAVLSFGSNKCFSQSALETLKAMGGNARINVPPVSDPVCCYCGANRSDSPRREAHKPGCPNYEGGQRTSNQNSSNNSGYQAYTGSYNYNAQGDHHYVTYADHAGSSYVPPKPIRETAEGQAMLEVAGAAGEAVAAVLAEGLRALFSWGSERVFSRDHHGREYDRSVKDKNWGTMQVIEKNGTEGIWDKGSKKWYVKPGKYHNIHIFDGYGVVLQDKNGKWGMIEPTDNGRILVQFEYDDCMFISEGGTGSPVVFGYKDEKGYMHYMIGRNVLDKSKNAYHFDFYDGHYSQVEITGRQHPTRGELIALIAKDYDTGKSKIMSYNCNNIFGARQDEKYDDVILTGMMEVSEQKYKDLNGREVTIWDDYYKVKNNGKMGYVVTRHNTFADHSYGSSELLSCDYDNVTPLETQAYVYESMHNQYSSRSSKELVITEKDGKFGVGFTYSESAKKPKYDDIGIVNIRDADGDLMPVAITKEGNKYTARRLDSIPIYWDDGSRVEANDFLKVIDRLNKHTKACPHAWRKMKIKK